MLEVLLQNNEDDIDVNQLADANRVHPLIALYKKRSAEHIGKALFDGERKLSTALNGLNMKTVLVSDGQAAALTNVNTTMDFEKIEKKMEIRIRYFGMVAEKTGCYERAN